MSILIKNGKVIDPGNNIFDTMDLFIKDGKIFKLEKNINEDADKIIDAENMWVTPGFIDIHVHAREPGYEYKETLETVSKSGAVGGFTTICVMPNTKPVTDNKEVVSYINNKAKDSVINVLVIGSITKNQDGFELADFEEMRKEGIVALSEDGKTVENSFLMKEALKKAKQLNLNVLSHCEDKNLTGKGQMHEGRISEKLGLCGIPKDSEEIIIARDIILANSVKTRLHICHISTKDSVRLVKEAKERGEFITAEVTPHHFVLCDEDIKKDDANFKMAPPLRSKEDIEAVLQGLKDGTIEVIATDHAPHSFEEKSNGFEKSLNGIVGLETSLPLGITYLVNKNILTPSELIKKMTINPAKVIGLEKGTLTIGKDADVTIINPNKEYKINVNNFKSKSKNSPFNNFNVKGKVIHTIVSGKIVVENEKLILN